MEPAFTRWLKQNGFEDHVETFFAAGYYSSSDMVDLSEEDARCVAEEEIRMNPEQTERWVSIYTTCGTAEFLDTPQPQDFDGTGPLLRQGNYGRLSGYASRVLLECLPAVAFAQMGFLSKTWNTLVKHQEEQCCRADIFSEKAKRLAALRDETRLLAHVQSVSGKQHSEALAAGIALARELQRNLALERECLKYVGAAAASGIPDAAAVAAFEEACALGLQDHRQVRQLAVILGVDATRTGGGIAKVSAEHKARESGWQNRTGFHFDAAGTLP